MRIAALCAILLAQTACFLVPERFQDEREVCGLYLDCVASMTPDAFGPTVDLYGDDGPCWESETDASRCATACDAGRVTLWESDPEACPIEGREVPPPPSLTDAEREWTSVQFELVSGGCTPVDASPVLVTGPNGGDSLFADVPITEDLTLHFECDPDGDAYTCPTVRDSGFQALNGTVSANEDISEVVVTFDVGAGTGQPPCGTWQFTGQP